MVHGCMVYTEGAETAAVSCDTNIARTVSTHHGGYSKRVIKKKMLFTHVESHASAVSLLERGELCYIK